MHSIFLDNKKTRMNPITNSVFRFTDVEKIGAARVADTCPAAPHDTAIICYSPMMATDQRPKVVIDMRKV